MVWALTDLQFWRGDKMPWIEGLPDIIVGIGRRRRCQLTAAAKPFSPEKELRRRRGEAQSLARIINRCSSTALQASECHLSGAQQ